MDGNSKQLIEDCFLRPLTDAHSTNASSKSSSDGKLPLKTELQILRLSEESQKMVMDTLKTIHGQNFQLSDGSKYKDRGGRLKKTYWEDRGTLIVQSVSNNLAENRKDETEDRFRKYARLKLESYGYPTLHCNEALDRCNGQVEEALEILFHNYMKNAIEIDSDCVEENNDLEHTDAEILEMREDEKLALESIYDKIFEEKEKNRVWTLKFDIKHLTYNPKGKKDTSEEIPTNNNQNKQKAKCRNFAKGFCKFGERCRFSHGVEIKKEDTQVDGENSNEIDNNFYLEIRFSTKTRYPFEAPFIFIRTVSPKVSPLARLQLARKLYRDATDIAKDGMPCVYTLAEFLQMDEEIYSFFTEPQEPFPNPEKSLFHTEENVENFEGNEIADLPTHYKLGSTGNSEFLNLTREQMLREDQNLMRRLLEKKKQFQYQEMIKIRQNLPAWGKMIDILDTLEKAQVIVISGETGCGKSTQVPQFILDDWLFKSSLLDNVKNMKHCEIICTQPRRLSAIGVAERVAFERVERVGSCIGYQIRLENKISSSTRLTFCTTGILLRRLQSDSLLKSVTHIIVDEVHERSEESDFLLLILKRILKIRKDLKIILMSATLNAQLFSSYFGKIPIIEIPGRTFPVKQLFLEDILENCKYVLEVDSQYCRRLDKKEQDNLFNELEYADTRAVNEPPPKSIKDEKLNLSSMFARYSDYSKVTCKTLFLMDPKKVNPELIESVLSYIVNGDHDWPKEGSILIFLPGMAEIESVYESLCDSSEFAARSGKYIIVPLHSTLSNEDQALVFKKAPKGKRKIVLSTNIAETSITIDDCVFVIDTGLMKEKRYDANRNMESLDLVWESRANALQRKGRAGRVMPGVCIHLFTLCRYDNHILGQPVPEIHRVPLEQLLLRIKTLPNLQGCNITDVISETLEPPTEENVQSAIRRLQDVGAFDQKQNLTALGHHLSALPVDVRIGKLMLFGAIFRCVDSILTIAACLSHKSPFVSPFNKRTEADRKKKSFSVLNSDHLTVLIAYKKWLEASKRSSYAGRCFADENFLSWKTLETIIELKYQYLELLVSIGFIPTDLPPKNRRRHDNILELTGPEFNVYGENNRLLIALLCAALYPNIVKVLTPDKSYTMTIGGAVPSVLYASDLRFKTHEDGFVSIHPSSVNSSVGNYPSPFLVYQEKVKTSRVYIRECSMVPLMPLTFFSGSDLTIELHAGDFVILLDKNWIMLKAHSYETAEMIQCLRTELIKLLEEKIRDPCLNLLHHQNGKRIIETIIHVVTRD